MPPPRIWINEDNHHFYGCHPPEDMTPEGVDRLVDTYAEGGHVAGILFCVNVQRALFESETWETFYGDYDPSKGEDQPCLKRGHGIKNLWLLSQRGVDHHARWLTRCRHHGIEGWLTMRMNDAHGLKEHEVLQQDPHAEVEPSCLEWPSTFWRERPDLRRAPYRWERSLEGAFDYGKEEVREHHLRLARELLDRYDMDGLELDWLRWVLHFAPGGEQQGRKILTEFVREVRRLIDNSARRVGHPVKLAVRVPAEPQSCLELGYDVIAWAREGLIDMITVSSFLGCANFNLPLDIWRALLGTEIKILAHAESTARPHPSYERTYVSYEFLFASAASALHRGGDGIYLFNECYRESDDPELLKYVLKHAGDRESLNRTVRRHAVTYPQIYAPGAGMGAALPVPLKPNAVGGDFGRLEENITVRIAVGTLPSAYTACVRLGFSKETPVLDSQAMIVRINTSPAASIAADDTRLRYEDVAAMVKAEHGFPPDFPPIVCQVLCYLVPDGVLQDDINVAEFVPPQVEGELGWAEILIIPT